MNDDATILPFDGVYLTVTHPQTRERVDIGLEFAGTCEIDLAGVIDWIEVDNVRCSQTELPWLYEALVGNVRRAIHDAWDDWRRSHPTTRDEYQSLYSYQRWQMGCV
jgi:hypothetical protein